MKLQSYCSFYLISASYIPFITIEHSYVAPGRKGSQLYCNGEHLGIKQWDYAKAMFSPKGTNPKG